MRASKGHKTEVIGPEAREDDSKREILFIDQYLFWIAHLWERQHVKLDHVQAPAYDGIFLFQFYK